MKAACSSSILGWGKKYCYSCIIFFDLILLSPKRSKFIPLTFGTDGGSTQSAYQCSISTTVVFRLKKPPTVYLYARHEHIGLILIDWIFFFQIFKLKVFPVESGSSKRWVHARYVRHTANPTWRRARYSDTKALHVVMTLISANNHLFIYCCVITGLHHYEYFTNFEHSVSAGRVNRNDLHYHSSA